MDDINTLPIDNSRRLSSTESDILDKYFQPNSVAQGNAPSRSYSEFKTVAIASVLFMILSTPYFDKLVEMLPHTGSPLFKYIIKAIIFFALMYIALIMLN
jgi:hypothetical protein